MTAPHWSIALKRLGACSEAVMWAKAYKTPSGAWRACKRADWMLWIAALLAGPTGDDSRKAIVMAACECARTALEFVPEGELRPLRAIETAEAWCAGRASLNEVLAAAYYAAAAAPPAHAEAFHAASLAALAVDAASSAARAALAAHVAARAEMAPVVRRHLKCPRLQS